MAILLTVFVEGLISESSAWAHNVTVSTTFLVQAYIADLFWVHVVTVSTISSKNGINIGDSAEVQGVKVSISDNVQGCSIGDTNWVDITAIPVLYCVHAFSS
jgi:hypothetical protein